MKKILKLKEIVIDKMVYPRQKWNWKTVYDYQESMRAGAIFPLITVALFNRKYYLLDGRHRLEALKNLKEKYTQAEVLKNLSKKEIYIEAVKRNIGHGMQFSVIDKVKISLRLEKLEYSKEDISKLIQIPIDKLDMFTADRVTNTISGEIIYLKAPVKHLVGRAVIENFDNVQDKFIGASQLVILDELINLLENNLMDLENDEVFIRLKRIKVLLRNVRRIRK